MEPGRAAGRGVSDRCHRIWLLYIVLTEISAAAAIAFCHLHDRCDRIRRFGVARAFRAR
jgi:hypothetical protein